MPVSQSRGLARGILIGIFQNNNKLATYSRMILVSGGPRRIDFISEGTRSELPSSGEPECLILGVLDLSDQWNSAKSCCV